jgi:rhamnogalacturonyl hydrolase YesR
MKFFLSNTKAASKVLCSTSTRKFAFAALLAIGVNCQPAHANYRQKAIEATDYIQKTFFDEKAGLYRPSVPAEEKALPYDFMWANGVQFSALVGAARHEPQRYKPTMYAFARSLERYWDKNSNPPGFDAYFASPDGDDKYYDDNAWLVLGFAEAYRDTRDAFFLDWARRTHNFVLSGWDEKQDGGIYWYQVKRESKNTCSNAPTATAALELFHIGRDPRDLEWAKRIHNWTCSKLQDKDGLFWDNINLKGEIERTKWTYNTALMIRSNLGLWRATKEKRYLQEATRVSDAALARWADPATGGFADSARFNHLLSEALLQTYEATRNMKYLNAVRRDADFAYRYVRDAQNGGYWNQWKIVNRPKDERKTLIENASVARLFWLLTPYLDVEELRARGEETLRRGDRKAAIDWWQQALESTAGAPLPTNAPTKVL